MASSHLIIRGGAGLVKGAVFGKLAGEAAAKMAKEDQEKAYREQSYQAIETSRL